MWFTPTDPNDSFHSQLQHENFLEEQQRMQEFMNSVKSIADSAMKKSIHAEIRSWIAIAISFSALILQAIDVLCK